jgi:hypothetical protein
MYYLQVHLEAKCPKTNIRKTFNRNLQYTDACTFALLHSILAKPRPFLKIAIVLS